jgi:hypothetical protein
MNTNSLFHHLEGRESRMKRQMKEEQIDREREKAHVNTTTMTQHLLFIPSCRFVCFTTDQTNKLIREEEENEEMNRYIHK